LAVSLSTTDAIGHRFGPDSRELHDQVLRLDRALGVFLDSLFALRGRENVVIALTGDHGVAPVPEIVSSWGDNRKATRVREAQFTPIFNEIVPLVQRAEIPLDAFSFDFPTVEVDRSKAVGKERELLRIARAFAASARRIPGVMRVDVIDDLARADTVKDDIARRWLHMFRPGGNAIIGITLDPFNYIGSGVASHGTPHDYDAHVPVLFFGSAFRQAKDEGAARVVDMAPTLAHLLGITPSERLDGQILGRAFVPAPE
jgi:arylsulfatase A-like enzyme